MNGYAKLYNSFWRSTKGIKLSRFNPAAGFLYIMAISMSNDELTDGHLSEDDLLIRLNGTQEQIDYLLANKLLEKTDSGYQIHDYLDWQRSSEDIENTIESNRERQRRWYRNHKKSDDDSDENPNTLESEPNTLGMCYVGVRPNDLTEPNANLTGKRKRKIKNKYISTTVRDSNSINARARKKSISHCEESEKPGWESKLASWVPSAENVKLAKSLDKRINVQRLADEFRSDIQATGNRHHFTDFDAAFANKIRFRARDLEASKPQESASSQDKNLLSDVQVEKVLKPYADKLAAAGGLSGWEARRSLVKLVESGVPAESAAMQAVQEAVSKSQTAPTGESQTSSKRGRYGT